MLNSVIGNPWVRAVGFLLVLAVAALTVKALSSVLVPVFLAFIVAYMLDPVVDRIELFRIPWLKRSVPRVGAVVVLVIGVLILALLLPVIMIPGIFVGAGQLIETASQGLENNWIDRGLDTLHVDRLLEEIGWMEPVQPKVAGIDPATGQEVQEGMKSVQPPSTREALMSGIGQLARVQAAALLQSHVAALASVGQRAGASVAAFFSSFASGVVGLVIFLGNFVLFAFIAIYLLNDYDRIVATTDGLVPPRHREAVHRIMSKIDHQLKAFLRGQTFVCLCLGSMYGLGLWISGIPFALALAIFGGVASFVPFLGLALTIGPALLLGLLQPNPLYACLGVLVTFGVAQAIEGNFLTPKIVGSQVGLSPVWVILAIMVFSTTLGFLGLLLAVPIASVLKVLLEEGLDVYRRSAFFQGKCESEAGG